MNGSLRERFAQYWSGVVQGRLFPVVREEIGPLHESHQRVMTTLEVVRIEEEVPSYRGFVGRPQKDRGTLARAFVAKAALDLPTTRQLLDRLSTDRVLRQIVGWERGDEIPDESTFSRAFAEFAQNGLGERAHAALIEETQGERLIGHISRDATEIEAREAPVKVEKPAPTPKPRGRPKKGEVRERELTRLERQRGMTLEAMLDDLPKHCSVGCKTNSKGFKESWVGYKLHWDVADGGVPISCILTSAHVHDSQVALPLAEMTDQRVTHLYDLLDAAYDAPIIRVQSAEHGHVALIDHHPRGGEKIEFAPHEAERFKERTTVERANARLKDEFGGRFIRVRGHAKVMAHLMFGILALTADQLLRFID